MKVTLCTIVISLAATTINADISKGKDALRIIDSGKIIHEQLSDNGSIKVPSYFKYLTVIKNDKAYLCSVELNFNSDWLRPLCVDISLRN